MRNYTALHYIQDKLQGYDPRFVRCVTNDLNLIDDYQEGDGCLSDAVVLYVCAKEYGYDPILCYGLCEINGFTFYHAWLELDNLVIDLGIYGNTNYCTLTSNDGQLLDVPKRKTPYIGPYDNDEITYRRFELDEDWEDAPMSMIDFLTIEEYIDFCPNDGMWELIFRVLDRTRTNEELERLRRHVSGVEFSGQMQKGTD